MASNEVVSPPVQMEMASDITSEVDGGILMDSTRRKSRSHSLKDCHVQFDPVVANTGKSDEAAINTIWRGDNNVEIQLGFLQYLHKYEVNFTLDGPYPNLCPQLGGSTNKNARVISIERQSEGTKHDIKMEVYVSTDKVLHEKCPLHNEEDQRKGVTLNLHAKVLSKDKGTPLLKKGIHCTEHYQDEESEYGS